ncbi:MAG TPA: hypothetical protein VJS92_12250, partial [Candidatus Polarisedimenticolaceae bacterium]|nr:hypothetical protein [Candidatus Polarisedimenticolaceae bacterium]
VLPAALVAADDALREARSALDEVLVSRSAGLSPDTLAALEASLREMESATRQLRRALARDPGNRGLQQMLLASHHRELSVLRDVTLIAARQDRRARQELSR